MRLIDADEFEKDINKCFRYSNTTLINNYEVLHRLNNAPTIDAVEVVRCFDCKYLQCNMREDGILPFGVDEYECRHWCGYCDPMDFCSYGERREE